MMSKFAPGTFVEINVPNSIWHGKRGCIYKVQAQFYIVIVDGESIGFGESCLKVLGEE